MAKLCLTCKLQRTENMNYVNYENMNSENMNSESIDNIENMNC